MVTGQLPHTILSFLAPPNLQPFFPNCFHKRSLKTGAPGKASPRSVSKKVPSQHIPVACATVPVSIPSQEERRPQSSSDGWGLVSLLYLQVTEQTNSFPGKTGWGRTSTRTSVRTGIQLLPGDHCSRAASFGVDHAQLLKRAKT